MKLYRILYMTVLASFVAMATSCVTSETTITAPDGTVTRTKTSGPDGASVAVAGNVAAVAAEIVIHRDK